MNLCRISFTAADESVGPEQLAALSSEFPYVEWGILLCRSYQGKREGYPGSGWLRSLERQAEKSTMNLAAHLCGGYAREAGRDGRLSVADEFPQLFRSCSRLQFNFGRYRHEVRPEKLIEAMKRSAQHQHILQISAPHDAVLLDAVRAAGVDAAALFDRSRGRGISPGRWPAPLAGMVCGYAGGLRPESLPSQLEAIAAVAEDRSVYLDMQSGVRNDYGEFDLERVRQCLAIVDPPV